MRLKKNYLLKNFTHVIIGDVMPPEGPLACEVDRHVNVISIFLFEKNSLGDLKKEVHLGFVICGTFALGLFQLGCDFSETYLCHVLYLKKLKKMYICRLNWLYRML